MERSEAPASRKQPATATPFAYRYRASCRLYEYMKTKSLINSLLNKKLHIKNHLPK